MKLLFRTETLVNSLRVGTHKGVPTYETKEPTSREALLVGYLHLPYRYPTAHHFPYKLRTNHRCAPSYASTVQCFVVVEVRATVAENREVVILEMLFPQNEAISL